MIELLIVTVGASEEAEIEDLENCTRNGGSLREPIMDSFGAPGSNSDMEHQCLGVSLQGGAFAESSMCHNYSTTSRDHLSPFDDSQWISLRHDDSWQGSTLNTDILTGLEDERGMFCTEGASFPSEVGSERWRSTSTSFLENLPADDTGIMGYGWNELEYHFPVMGGSYSAGADTEALEQPNTWSSLYASTLSSEQPIITDGDIAGKSSYSADEKSGVTRGGKALLPLISSFPLSQQLKVHKEIEEEDMARPSKRARDNADGFAYGYSMEDRNLKTGFPGQFLASSQSLAFSNRSSSCVKDESSSTAYQPSGIASYHPSNCSPESTQSNTNNCRSHVEDESDICIIEEMSHPAPTNQYAKAITSHNRSTFSDSHYYSGVGVPRPRTNSEQQIFRVALQVRLASCNSSGNVVALFGIFSAKILVLILNLSNLLFSVHINFEELISKVPLRIQECFFAFFISS